MCGRYYFDENMDLSRYLKILNRKYDQMTLNLWQKGEIFPSNIALTANATDLFLMKWGYTLYNRQLINTRLESIRDKSLYHDDFRDRKCVILASGFYEWKDKEKLYLTTAEPLIYLAGLYQQAEPFAGFSILTKQATDTYAIHERIPIVFNREDAYRYLRGQMDLTEMENNRPQFNIMSKSGNIALF